MTEIYSPITETTQSEPINSRQEIPGIDLLMKRLSRDINLNGNYEPLRPLQPLTPEELSRDMMDF